MGTRVYCESRSCTRLVSFVVDFVYDSMGDRGGGLSFYKFAQSGRIDSDGKRKLKIRGTS